MDQQPPVTPPPQPQPVYQQHPPTPKKNPGILVGIFLLILGIAVGLMIDKTTLLSRVPFLSATPTPTPLFTPAPTPDPTPNWKTYTDATYGFSFKYPSDEEVKQSQNAIGLYGMDSVLFEITTLQTTVTDPINWWTKQSELFGYPTTCFKQATLNSIQGAQKAISLEHVSKDFSCQGPNLGTAIIVSFNGKLFKITYNNSEVSNQILSTFKFTPQAQLSNEPAWNTFKYNGFSFEYPSPWKLESQNLLTGTKPVVTVAIAPNGTPLMNECMQLVSTEAGNAATIKRFTRVTTGEMCGTTDANPREVWIIPNQTGYTPGISYRYSAAEATEAESILAHIISTLKFDGQQQSCSYKGKTYVSGQSFPDSCNSCSCDNGQVACTMMACL